MFSDDPLSWLLLVGLVLQCFGFLVRDELYLRVLVAFGLCFGLAFYALRSEPIWGSALTNATMVAINLALITVIVLERTTFTMSERDKRMFEDFRTLSPGQFRRINRLATWHIAETDKDLLVEGAGSEQLYYIDAPAFQITKRGKDYIATGPAFAGEIMFLRGGVSSATVRVPKGTVYVVWQVNALRGAMNRSMALSNALIARFSLDMADKVAESVPMTIPPALKA